MPGTINDDRLKGGTLTLDGKQYADQATSVRLVPKTSDVGNTLETLSGLTSTPSEESSWELRVEAVQDFDNAAGFVAFCNDNVGDIVPYTWKPNASGVSYAGTIRVRPVEVGGDVNVRLTTPAVFPCQQAPTPTYPPA